MNKKIIPYGRQSISQSDIDAVVNVLTSDLLTQGPVVPSFEAAVATYCQSKYATAANSATSALHVACLALGVGEGDIVWTSPISFVASSNCALYCGATIDFVDIELETGNLSIAALSEKLEVAKRMNRLPKVVIPVHLAGQPCDMEAISSLAKTYDFKIIEDASHAIGAKYKGQPVGNCKYSDITVFSFHPVKIITSAEGGMALTNCGELDKKMKRFRSHGITSDLDEMTEPSHGPWYYQQVELGFNYRMTDLHASLGLSQLSRLDAFVKRRNELAQKYNSAFSDISNVQALSQSTDVFSSYHLYIVRLIAMDSEQHKKIICELRDQSIIAQMHYIPIHLHPFYERLGFQKGDYPQAEQYYQQAITLPLFPTMTDEQQVFVINTFKALL